MAPEVSPTIFTDDGGAENWHEEIILSFILSSIHSFIFDAFLSNCSLLISFFPPTSLSSFFFHCVFCPLFLYQRDLLAVRVRVRVRVVCTCMCAGVCAGVRAGVRSQEEPAGASRGQGGARRRLEHLLLASVKS